MTPFELSNSGEDLLLKATQCKDIEEIRKIIYGMEEKGWTNTIRNWIEDLALMIYGGIQPGQRRPKTKELFYIAASMFVTATSADPLDQDTTLRAAKFLLEKAKINMVFVDQ